MLIFFLFNPKQQTLLHCSVGALTIVTAVLFVNRPQAANLSHTFVNHMLNELPACTNHKLVHFCRLDQDERIIRQVQGWTGS